MLCRPTHAPGSASSPSDARSAASLHRRRRIRMANFEHRICRRNNVRARRVRRGRFGRPWSRARQPLRPLGDKQRRRLQALDLGCPCKPPRGGLQIYPVDRHARLIRHLRMSSPDQDGRARRRVSRPAGRTCRRRDRYSCDDARLPGSVGPSRPCRTRGPARRRARRGSRPSSACAIPGFRHAALAGRLPPALSQERGTLSGPGRPGLAGQ